MIGATENPRLLVANVFFAPRSFGGATVVAEEVTRRLIKSSGWDVTVVSYSNYGDVRRPTVMRTRLAEGADHYTINIGGVRTPDEEFEDADAKAEIVALIDRIKPDAAHIHCMQGLGLGLVDALDDAGVPTILSTHDYWWMCEKIFMLDALGKHCGQTVIDRRKCVRCAHNADTLDHRWRRAQETLLKPAIITYPSEASRMRHEVNGVPADKGRVLPNGVTHPKPDYAPRRAAAPSERLRFGYIGGPGPLKGWAMIERAFAALDPAKVELKVVDAAFHIGKSWWRTYDFGPIAEHVTVVPGYTMETVDAFFAELDVLLFLSTWPETFGLTAREAALRGVHVLATDCGAPVEHLTDGETATILPGYGSAGSLKAALKSIVRTGPPTPLPDALAKVDEMVIDYDRQAAEVDAMLRGLVTS